MIINDSLESGTQISYIKKAQEIGYGVVVLNHNENTRTGYKHFEYIWENVIEMLNSRVVIVAHSYGGQIAMTAVQRIAELRKRTFSIALTDSAHNIREPIKNDVMQWIKRHTRN